MTPFVGHGKTEHNKLGLFTGWEDAPLAPEGRAEAAAAGTLMAAHGIKLDVVYTSWLSRAIETAWLVLDEVRASREFPEDLVRIRVGVSHLLISLHINLLIIIIVLFRIIISFVIIINISFWSFHGRQICFLFQYIFNVIIIRC